MENLQKLKRDYPDELFNALEKAIENLYKMRLELKRQFGDIKRSPVDSLYEKGLMEPTALVEEIQRIRDKKSTLPSRERRFAEYILGMAVYELKHKDENGKM